MNEELRVAVLLGSVREGRFGPVVADWVSERVSQYPGMTPDLIDLEDHSPGDPAFARRIGDADAVIVVTPEYNHSYPGPLKAAIDSLRQEWVAKPVAFVSYGGVSGGLRAVEPLRVVFAELHAVTIRETVSFAFAHTRFDGEGRPKEEELVGQAADRLLRNLGWWARHLRDAVRQEAYPA